MDRQLIVSFVDQSPAYTYGFEAGMIWQRMQAREPLIEAVTRAENATTLRRMAQAAGYDVEFGASEMLEWEFARFSLPTGGGGIRQRASAEADARHHV